MSQRKRVLVVDDDPINTELIMAALAGQDVPHDTVVTHDGAEALDFLCCRGKFHKLEGQPPVLVLLDLKMPLVDGLEFLRERNASDSLKMIPVVVFTSSDEESDRLESYRLGANAYVVKPIRYEEFLKAIRSISAFWAGINRVPPAAPLGAQTAPAADAAAA